jgi:hypothetical protein
MQNEKETSATTAQQTAAPNEGGFTTLSGGVRVPAGMGGIAAGYLHQSNSGANWFLWIAGLSLINSLISLASGRLSFLVGLGVTQLIDGFAAGVAEQLGGANAVKVIALFLDLIVAGFFVGLGLFARKQHTWAFVMGMVIYALDALIFILFQGWLSVLFHAYVLYRLYQGFAANNKLKTLQAEAAVAGNSQPQAEPA